MKLLSSIGFTGTRQQLPRAQHGALVRVMRDFAACQLHHGDCVGGDKAAHMIALDYLSAIVIHPPTDSVYRAFCHRYTTPGVQIDVCDRFDYLIRNHHIVEGRDVVVATPRTFVMPTNLRGEGTWTTVRYAKQAHVPLILIIDPVGNVREEPS